MDISTESLVLGGLAQSEDFAREVAPYLEDDYFSSKVEKLVFTALQQYRTTYKTIPDKTVVALGIRNIPTLTDTEREAAEGLVNEIYNINIPKLDLKWLMRQAEDFCQKKAVYLAIMQSISIYDGTDKVFTTQAIPGLLQKAIGISFDSHIGSDFFDDAESRYDYYTSPDSRVPFDISILNQVTNGGVKWKTLNIILAGINVGKTLSMIHMACAYLKMGYNVLYFTMEMAENEILNRVDANLLNLNMNSITDVPRDQYLTKIGRLKTATNGRIKVKEYPPGIGTAAHFKKDIHDLEMKHNFKAQIIIIDYLGITGSSRIKVGTTNSYFYLKSVAEELRALAVETTSVLWTAMQLTRSGNASSDIDMTDVSESMGVPATADFMLSLSRTDELDQMGQLLAKQIKSRYGKKTTRTKFVVGVDLDTQKLYDVNQTEQETLVKADHITERNVNSSTDTSKFRNRFAEIKV